ncbi:MAG: 6-carboxytetrahydropterin synthase [Phycisphaerales bacterium]|nr:6-carboxytetrahydropterin synthase [Phycisphaerales bacterium]
MSTKTYGHDVGLSVAFRQWKATSHCNRIHGYALSISFVFEADQLDARGWVVDFGGLKGLKRLLEEKFDHKTIVAGDDPALAWFMQGHENGTLDLVVLPGVGCERFAEHIFHLTERWLSDEGLAPRCRLRMVEVKEHGANSAIYTKG